MWRMDQWEQQHEKPFPLDQLPLIASPPPQVQQIRTTKVCYFTVSIGQESWDSTDLKGGGSQNDSRGSSHWKSWLGLDNYMPNSTLAGLLASGLSASLTTWPWLPWAAAHSFLSIFTSRQLSAWANDPRWGAGQGRSRYPFDLTSEIAYHHFCHIPFVRSTSSRIFQGRGIRFHLWNDRESENLWTCFKISKNLEGIALNNPSGIWIVKGKEIWIDIRVCGQVIIKGPTLFDPL